MNRPSDFPPDVGSQPLAPGEVPRGGTSQFWLVVGVALVALVAALLSSHWMEDLRARGEAMLATATQSFSPSPRSAPSKAPPVARRKDPPVKGAAPAPATPAKPATQPAKPHDDLARPLAFYFARWGVVETLSPIGWTSRIELRSAAGGGGTARLWITCPKGICEAGVFAVKPIAHLKKKDQTAYLVIERRESDKVWTLLLRPATGRPDELERWEWYGPPGSSERTQSLLGHVRRVRPDGSFY